MLFAQILDDDLGCASYLVGDERAGIAAVVDPPYAIEPLLREAERREVRLVAVLETHTHADHVSGHGRLALEHAIPVRVHAAAGAVFPHEPIEDGTEIVLGDVVLRTIHTPGHRPEHCCFAVTDRSRGDEPWLVLTGDSLFVGDAARPDLAVEAREGAEGLFHSLRRLAELGDGVEVFPGHVAGSLCGAGMSSRASTTIGFERRFNRAMQGKLQDFVAGALGPQPPRPPNMERIVELNRGEFLGAQPPLRQLDSPPRMPSSSTSARPTPSRRGTGRAPSASRSRARALRPRLHSSCRSARSSCMRRTRPRRSKRPAGSTPSGCSSSPAGRREAETSSSSPSRSRSSSACWRTTRSSCSTYGRRTSTTTATSPARRTSPTGPFGPRPRTACSTAGPW